MTTAYRRLWLILVGLGSDRSDRLGGRWGTGEGAVGVSRTETWLLEIWTSFYFKFNMANCPNCGSDHIHIKKETNVDWGRAVAGWALFGVVGGAVGAVTGDDRNVNACLNCGTSWKAADLYKTLQVIKSLTGISLDLAQENHRSYLNNFIHEIGSSLESISEVEKQSNKLVAEAESKRNERAAQGCTYGCFTSVAGCTAMASTAATGNLMLILFLPPLIGFGSGILLDKISEKAINRRVERAKLEGEQMKAEAEQNLRNKVELFMAHNSL